MQRGQRDTREVSGWGRKKLRDTAPGRAEPNLCSSASGSRDSPLHAKCSFLCIALPCHGLSAPDTGTNPTASPRQDVPAHAWTTLYSLASPVLSNDQSQGVICWLLGRKMLGFLFPPQTPALIIYVSKGSLWHKHADIHTLTSPRPLLQERSIPRPPPHRLTLQLPLQRDASPRQVPDENTDVGDQRGEEELHPPTAPPQSPKVVTSCPQAVAGTTGLHHLML